METVYKQYFSYIAFAIIAITINISCQALVEFLLKEFFSSVASMSIDAFNRDIELWFGVALGTGTLVGFIFKFIVDKWIVFQEQLREDETMQEVGRQFSLYFIFAIFTTMIFWGIEGLFYLIAPEWYLIGGIIGLAIGYTVKFILDRQYCFPCEEISEIRL